MEPDSDVFGSELASLWGSEGLRRCPARALRGVAIPDTSKRFLTEYGLPASWGGIGFFANVGNSLPRLDDDHPHYRPLHAPFLSRFYAGVSQSTFCLDERRSGAVVSVYSREDVEADFVNGSVELFAAHWVLHRKLLTEAAALSEQIANNDAYQAAVYPLLNRTEREMRHLEPSVWEGLTEPRDHFYGEGDTGYWPGMLSEYAVYAMWDAEEVLARWLGPPTATR